jgi:antitoxin (DNA-binding transcriptional repressor) of toxin-antitoxin stability system
MPRQAGVIGIGRSPHAYRRMRADRVLAGRGIDIMGLRRRGRADLLPFDILRPVILEALGCHIGEDSCICRHQEPVALVIAVGPALRAIALIAGDPARRITGQKARCDAAAGPAVAGNRPEPTAGRSQPATIRIIGVVAPGAVGGSDALRRRRLSTGDCHRNSNR